MGQRLLIGGRKPVVQTGQLPVVAKRQDLHPVQIVGVARAMGMRNRVTWRVTKWDPPHEVAMTGSGKGGTKYGVTLTVRPTKGGSALGLRLELGGRALFGPLGSAAARAVKGDVEKSLKQFAELYG